MFLDLPPAEVAALLATALGVAAAVPQMRRVVVASDGRGVSLSGALLGVVNETVWIAYTVHGALWSAAPEAVLMAASNVVLVVWLLRGGAGGWGGAAVAATCWAVVLAAVATIGGAPALAVTLGVAYGVQVVPAVWTAWRTTRPTGVAAATWGMILVESALWGVYGLHHGDPATTTLAVVGTAGAVAMLARKAVAGLCPRSVDGCLVSTP